MTKLSRERNQTAEQAVPVVGIGASAGGLEAFTELLEALPPDTGMAFVLISHLMREQKSMLSELLSRATSMPVTQVQQKTFVEPNHVYVIAPDKELTIDEGYLKIKTLIAADRPSMVIDRFFRSLAQDRKSKAIGVILSGSGSDGSRGLAGIKGEDGITFVQDASAKFADMPRTAQASADYVLPPREIANELKRIANHPYVHREPAAVSSALDTTDVLKQIFRLIRQGQGVDFSHYKPAGVRRRIARRMVLKKIETLAGYFDHLRSDKEEVQALYQDLLITVTEFFRDPDVFEFLRSRIIPRILEALPVDTPARVWVPGCATGEEVYSIVMCFVEASRDRGGLPVQVFGTDISHQGVAKAHQGFYPESIATNVSPERLRRFFMREGGGYRVHKFIRDLCIFAEQDVIGDAPFSRMDLVSCRNLLIYLDTPTQKEVLHRFHYALKPTGFLLLGTSESTGGAPELFEQVCKPHRIYTRLQVATRVDFALGSRSTSHGALAKAAVAAKHPVSDIGKDIDQLLLRRFAPSGVVLNSSMDILQFRGMTSGIIEPKPGEASLNIFRIIREELIVPLRATLHEARMGSIAVRKEGLEIKDNGHKRTLNLEIIRLKPQSKDQAYYLVLFEEPSKMQLPERERRRNEKMPTAAPAVRIIKLKQELKAAEERMRSISEDQESTNEELQSANEEILASNEELQSMNEEMQTAREELQATNEELRSVNDELQKRNGDLSQAYRDLNNLVLSLDIASVLVDNDLRIRRITPAARKVLNLMSNDVGRPITDIRPNIKVPDLPGTIAGVISSMSPAEQTVQDSNGHWYSMRIRPYEPESGRIEGAVLLFVDIDSLKRAQAATELHMKATS
jgi:two-component system CheB/CheR fusion protein